MGEFRGSDCTPARRKSLLLVCFYLNVDENERPLQ